MTKEQQYDNSLSYSIEGGQEQQHRQQQQRDFAGGDSLSMESPSSYGVSFSDEYLRDDSDSSALLEAAKLPFLRTGEAHSHDGQATTSTIASEWSTSCATAKDENKSPSSSSPPGGAAEHFPGMEEVIGGLLDEDCYDQHDEYYHPQHHNHHLHDDAHCFQSSHMAMSLDEEEQDEGQREHSSASTIEIVDESVLLEATEQSMRGGRQRRQRQRFQHEPQSSATLHLELDGPLYGREREARLLLSAYERCCHVNSAPPPPRGDEEETTVFSSSADPIRPAEVVLLTGASGTGKTALARKVLQPHVRKHGGYFISGKFDQLSRSEQYYPLKQAFQEFVQQLLSNERPLRQESDVNEDRKECDYEYNLQKQRRDIRRIIEPIVFSEPLLLEMLPVLKQLLRPDESENNDDDVDNNDGSFRRAMRRPSVDSRLSHSFCRLIRSVCSPQRPLVLFLDDLQWADTASLNLLSALVNSDSSGMYFSGSSSSSNSNGNNGLMILGACRGNEVSVDHDLSVTLRDLEEDGVGITDINLSNLQVSAINEMASAVLSISLDRTTKLASFLHEQTGGNALFVRQLFLALGDDGYFEKDPSSQQYMYELDDHDLNRVNRKLGRRQRSLDKDSAVRLVTKRIQQQLNPKIQRILMLASCFGAEFEESLLEVVERKSVRSLLLAAEQRDLITRVVMTGTNKWRFEHDQIESACYGLIPEPSRERTHLDIGWSLCQTLSQEDLELHLNTIIDQLRRGADLIESQDDRDEVALLCLKAGEMATKASAFQSAAEHLHLGIRLLGQRNWRDQYYLSLDIYMAAAEVEYCCGNFAVMDQLIAEVLKNARCVEDRLRAYTTQVYSLGSRSELQQALDLGLEVLERDLGESFPRNPTKPRIAFLLSKTKRRIRKLSDDNIMNLPTMRDSNKLMSMRLICIIAVYAYLLSSPLFPLLLMRLVRMTVKHGISAMSAPAFGFWGTLLCNVLGDVSGGVRYARLSLALWESQNRSREWQSRVQVFSHGFCLIWTDSLCDQLEPLKQAHSAGLLSGDIECGFLAAVVYSKLALHVSIPLPQLADELSCRLSEAVMLKQDIYAHFLRPLVQVALNLLGRSRDPCILTSDVMDETESFRFARETKNTGLFACLCSVKLTLSYLFGRIDEAERLSTMIDKECSTDTFSSLALGDLYLYQSLTALAGNGGKSSRRRAVRRAKQKLKKLKYIAKLNPNTFQSQVLIVEGEIAASKDEIFRAVRIFDEAAECARKDRVMGEIALAHERAAVALLRGACGGSTANEYFEKAIAAYSAWGAAAKVDHLKRSLITDDST